MDDVCIMSWYPKFNGWHFGLPGSSLSREWLDWVAISCEWWHMHTGSFKICLHLVQDTTPCRLRRTAVSVMKPKLDLLQRHTTTNAHSTLTFWSMFSWRRLRSSRATSQFCMRISQASFPQRVFKKFSSLCTVWQKEDKTLLAVREKQSNTSDQKIWQHCHTVRAWTTQVSVHNMENAWWKAKHYGKSYEKLSLKNSYRHSHLCVHTHKNTRAHARTHTFYSYLYLGTETDKARFPTWKSAQHVELVTHSVTVCGGASDTQCHSVWWS